MRRANSGSGVVTAFARQTGDIAVLSSADIRVLALCLTLELEENGSWRVRDHPGQILTGPPKEVVAVDALATAVEELKVEVEEPLVEAAPVASTSASTSTEDVPEGAAGEDDEEVEEEDSSDFEVVDHEENEGEEGEDDAGNESDDSNDSSSSWITPDNLVAHKVKDLGLFTPPLLDGEVVKPKSIMKAAVLTGDFAMQNVALQMGLNVLGSG